MNDISGIKQELAAITKIKQKRFLYKKNYATLERKIAREGIKLYG